MLVYPKEFCIFMEDQVPPSNQPQSPEQMPQPPLPQMQGPGGLDPQMIALLKARAREEAIRMAVAQRQEQSQEPADYPIPQPMAQAMPQNLALPRQEPRVVYVRRNLTVAELIVVFAISCGIVTGIQQAWNFAADLIPRIEIKTK